MQLAPIETYYDTVARAVARSEVVGPFTLFVAEPGAGMQFYARPRLGATEAITADDVRRVLDRQRVLGVPRAIEWVDEVTPSLLPAVRDALDADVPVELCPLLALTVSQLPAVADRRYRVLDEDDPDLALAVGTVRAAFARQDVAQPADPGRRPDLIAAGQLVVVAAYDDSGEMVGAGSTAPRGEVAELMGIGVLPRARRQGHGAGLTRALTEAAAARGVSTAFLSAGSGDAARIYRALGFVDIGTSCILEQAHS